MATPKLSANGIVRQVDLPEWEMIRQMPAVSSALSSGCAAPNSLFNEMHGRYLYYLVASVSFWRYDTWSDAWMQLASPPAATTSQSAMEFLGDYGPEGPVISATSTTLEIAGVNTRCLEGYEVRIVSGTGRGQRRMITSQAEPVVADRGLVTDSFTTNLSFIVDSSKTWDYNQWVGYSMRIEFSNGVSQIRNILYNDVSDITYSNAAMFVSDMHAGSTALSPTIVAGSTIYSIESSTVTVNAAWATTPDETSQYRVLTGVIAMTHTNSLRPLMYNIGEDCWYIWPVPASLAPVSTESRLASSNETASVWWNGAATLCT